MDTATLIDKATPEHVLVIGSLPPKGRDLDLLVRPLAETALTSVLAAGGFHRRGHTWARFSDCEANVVELIPARSLELQPEQLDQLYAQARPIEDLTSVVGPAPHHRLLLTARRVAAEATLRSKQRALAAEADEATWREACELAPAWGWAEELAELRRALDGSPPTYWRPRSLLIRATGYKPGALIALSGLDGSGKSTQAEGLVRSLSTLGYPTVAVWTTLGGNRMLDRLAAPVRVLLGPSAQQEGSERPPAGEDEDRLTRLRERWPWLHAAWVNFVAAMNAWWHVRATRPHLIRGRIVVCDRYVLDSIVQMRYRYGASRHYRMQLGLIRLLSPKPLRAYLLEVSPDTVHTRNGEYTHSQIELRAHLYREEYARLGVIRLDGERSREELCAQLALEVWGALAERDSA